MRDPAGRPAPLRGVILALAVPLSIVGCAAHHSADAQGANAKMDGERNAARVLHRSPIDTLPTPLATAMERLLALLENGDDALIHAAFSREFLLAVPTWKIALVLRALHEQVGSCRSHRPLSIHGTVEGVIRVECQQGAFDAKIHVEPDAPYLMDGLLVRRTAL